MIDLEKINIQIQKIEENIFEKYNLEIFIARFDLIHNVVSGNKLFKLFYFLQDALKTGKKIVTYGGAYSNHLVATAFACKNFGISCKGIVNGEAVPNLSQTLLKCLEYGMELEFVSRDVYRDIKYGSQNNSVIEIPEGGFHISGKDGASLMWHKIKHLKPDYLCLPVGSATTLAGLVSVADVKELIAFPAIKNMIDINDRLTKLNATPLSKLVINNDFHFGGFAKKNDELINFIKYFNRKHNIPLDFIYTAKMIYGIYEMIKSGYFLNDSRILIFHTGGVQGNEKGLLMSN